MEQLEAKKVLYVVHYPIFGGPHNQARRLSAPLATRGCELTVLIPSEPGNAADRLRSANVLVEQISLHRVRATLEASPHLELAFGFIPEVVRIRRLIRRMQADVVMIGGLANPHAAIAARLEGVPVVWRIVDSRTPGPLRAMLMPLVRRLADVVMFNGDSLIDLHGGRRMNIPALVYYPSVDTRHFRVSPERRQATRVKVGIPADVPVVGMVANLNPQKGIEYFIRAAGAVYEAVPDAWFLIVGSPHETHREYQAQIQAEIQVSGVPAERIIFAGGQADVEDWYPAMDVKLITSVPKSEGTTTTAMEAMACGVPIVATDVGAVREVVEHGITGLVVQPLDPAAISTATLQLLCDSELRSRMGKAGRERAVERYDVEVSADIHTRAFRIAIRRAERRKSGGR